jgi:hypothetical protein
MYRQLTQTHHGLVDLAIAAIAGPQQGLITTRQLLELGLSRGAIAHRIRVGRLHCVFRGVYAVGHAALPPNARALAAVLACGPGAVLSHGSAATLWGIDKHWRAPLEVTTRACRRSDDRLHTHRSRTLTPRDITHHFGIPVTSPARTLFDNAYRLTDRELARAVNELRLERVLWRDDLAGLVDRHPNTRAVKRLCNHLERWEDHPTRSPFEDDFRAFAKRYGLPEPLINTKVTGKEADVFFPEHKLVVELDGWDTHSSRSQFESDRDRDADRLAAGIATVRLTRQRFDNAPEREAARLKAILTAQTSSR